jgi:DNA-binding response OmpR family regulator
MGNAHLAPEEIVDLPSSQTPSPINGSIPEKISTLEIEKQENETQPRPRPLPQLASAAKKKNVTLLVDDNADLREYIRGALEPVYTVVGANDGREGLQKAQEILPDIVICDIMMPVMDGYELCRILKTNIETSHIPIIFLTARASQVSILQGLETGADDYIIKPFNTKILNARIKNLIDLRHQMQQKIKSREMLQPAEKPVPSMDENFIKELQEVTHKNLSDPQFDVEQLCKRLYMSQPTLYRKIRALTGESPTRFIQSYRLKRAAQLLKANFGNVTEVAFEVDFSSSAYFTKCFKEKFHRLPHSFLTSQEPHGMGDLLKFASFFMSFSNSSPSPVTCTCHL